MIRHTSFKTAENKIQLRSRPNVDHTQLRIKALITAGLYCAFSSVVQAKKNNPAALANTLVNQQQPYVTRQTPPISQLAEAIQKQLQLKKPLSFRDVTPLQVSGDFLHLQQTYQGLDVDGGLIAIKLDEHGQLLRVYGEPVTSFLTSNAASASATTHHLSPNTSPSARHGHNTLSTKTINTSTLNTQHSLLVSGLNKSNLESIMNEIGKLYFNQDLEEVDK